MISKLLIGLVKAYRFFLSPWLGSACRFEPSCSLYALEALRRHGALAGSPWCDGGRDPVPVKTPGPFTGLLTSSSEKKTP